MVSTDPISDMLTRIRNAIAVRKSEVRVPHSKMKEAVARILAANRFLIKVDIEDGAPQKTLILTLAGTGLNAPISFIERVSTPGRRMYSSADKIPTVKNGRGLVILSTSKGVMTGTDAQKERIGGELICKVY